MAKKNKKSSTAEESPDSPVSPEPTTLTATKSKDHKPSQPSTSALIICRNKYVLHGLPKLISIKPLPLMPLQVVYYRSSWYIIAQLKVSIFIIALKG
jgi:hypothetical protein